MTGNTKWRLKLHDENSNKWSLFFPTSDFSLFSPPDVASFLASTFFPLPPDAVRGRKGVTNGEGEEGEKKAFCLFQYIRGRKPRLLFPPETHAHHRILFSLAVQGFFLVCGLWWGAHHHRRISGSWTQGMLAMTFRRFFHCLHRIFWWNDGSVWSCMQDGTPRRKVSWTGKIISVNVP